MSRFEMCPKCGHRLSRVKDDWGRWDKETYVCYYCLGEVYDDDDVDDDEDENNDDDDS